MKLEFVSYDGRFPCACAGNLVMSIDGENVHFPELCLLSGGNVWFDEDWNDHIETGEWSIDEFPDGFPDELKQKAVELVNLNVEHGCCGGCV